MRARLASRMRSAAGTRPGASRYPRYAWAVVGFNLLVILWGAFVRATGSGAGCGNHWPLCNGEIIPRAPAVQTLIEFGHRAGSGLALLLVVGLVIGAWRGYPRAHPVRLAAALSGVFIVSDALIGAGVVLFEHVAGDTSLERGYWVAGHLTNTFLLLAALALTARWAGGAPPVRPRGQGRLALALLAGSAAVLLVGVSGAITALGDTLFPVVTLAQGKALTVSDSAHVFVRLRIWHPALAIAVGIALSLVALYAVRRQPLPTARRLAATAIVLWVAQLGLGAINVYLLAPVSVQLVHLLLSDLIWIAWVLFGAAALGAPHRARRGAT